jgi:hypothetical protein
VVELGDMKAILYLALAYQTVQKLLLVFAVVSDKSARLPRSMGAICRKQSLLPTILLVFQIKAV